MKQSNLVMIGMCILLFHYLIPASEAAISCGLVLQDLMPCATYLTGSSGGPPTECCQGVSKLVAAASTTADRRTACSCIKSEAAQLHANEEAAASLPSKCGISLPYTISPQIDCSKIN